MNKIGLSTLAVLAAAGAAFGQAPPAPSQAVINGMQYSTQFVVRSYGALNPVAGGASSLVDIANPSATFPLGIPAGTLLRFEIRYKITDTITNDVYKPGGLQGASFNVRTNVNLGAQQGTFAAGNLQTAGAIGGLYSSGANPGFRAAILTNNQNAAGGSQSSGAAVDASGFNTGSVRGLAEPLRLGFGTSGTFPNGGFFGGAALPADQTDPFVTAYNPTNKLGIFNILPLNTNPFAAASGTSYAVYAFDFQATAAQTTTWTFSLDTVSPTIAILGTGTNDDGDPADFAFPGLSVNNVGPITITFAVPAPGSAALLGLGGLLAARRRRTA